MRLLRLAAVVAAILAAGSIAPAAADPFDDAFNAYNNGDFATALQRFAPLAQGGDIRAQHMMGRMYSEGEGIRKNDAEGAKWYQVAADRGDTVSQLSLATMYVNGRGVRRNFVEAYKWFSIVALSGSRTAVGQALEVRDLIAQLMTPEQVEQGERLAAAWAPK